MYTTKYKTGKTQNIVFWKNEERFGPETHDTFPILKINVKCGAWDQI